MDRRNTACEDATLQMADALTGRLDALEGTAFRAHLDVCAPCRGEFARLESGARALQHAYPGLEQAPRRIWARLEHSLVARATPGAESTSAPSVLETPPAHNSSTVARVPLSRFSPLWAAASLAAMTAIVVLATQVNEAPRPAPATPEETVASLEEASHLDPAPPSKQPSENNSTPSLPSPGAGEENKGWRYFQTFPKETIP